MSMYLRKITFYVLIIFLLFSCERKSKTASLIQMDYDYKFSINAPSEVFYLSKKLREISGLSFDDAGHLLAINDEKAIIFKLDTTSGKIIDKVDFGKSDDYEGIAFGDDRIYIVESNGNIKVVDNESNKKIEEYNTKLSVKHDIEGAFYEPDKKVLLMASKSASKKGTARIFQFDFQQEKVTDTLKFEIDVTTIDSLRLHNMVKHFMVDITIQHRLREFAPSGIARDPLTGEYYILSSRGKLLVILSEKGKILAIKFLSKKVFGQPEGIVFDTFGNLYISNEAKSHKANILKFNRIDKAARKPIRRLFRKKTNE